MLSICAPIFDIQGVAMVTSPNPAGLTEFNRRVSRIATLDGGAAFNDFGYSDADRTLSVEFSSDSEWQFEAVQRMARQYSRLIVSFVDGCFLGAPESFRSESGRITLRILVERKLNG